ncbi:MAG: MFS transporter, partial [Solirubrobacteraceae bacterium]
AEPPPRVAGRWLVFTAVLIADVMDLVDSTITNVGGPTIRADLGGGQPLLQWLAAAYTLAFAVFLITGSRLGDLFGRRRLFLIGAAGFITMSALCSLAWSPGSLIALRVLQGSFGALMIPQGFGMMTEIFQDDEMAKVFGVFGPVMGLSSVVGPILGALLIDANLFDTGWRLVFLINVPLGLIALYFGWRHMPRNVVAPGGGIDPVGMLLIGAASLGLIYPLIEGREKGWPAWTFVILALGVVIAVGFVLWERRRPTDNALVQFSLLKNVSFTSSMAVAVFFFAAVSGIMLVLALFWQVGEGRTPIQSAVALAPLSIGMVIGMIASFALIEKLGRKLVQIGMVVTALGLLAMAASIHGSQHPSAWTLVPAVALVGAGMGQVFGQLFDVALASLSEHEVGSATGVLNALQQLSFSFGVAAVGTLFFDLLDVPHLPSDALAITALVSIIPLAFSFVLAFRLPAKPRPEGAGAH